MKNIPILFVEGKSLAEAYEKALVTLYKNGIRYKTQYDKEGEPLSLDARPVDKCHPDGIIIYCT